MLIELSFYGISCMHNLPLIKNYYLHYFLHTKYFHERNLASFCTLDIFGLISFFLKDFYIFKLLKIARDCVDVLMHDAFRL